MSGVSGCTLYQNDRFRRAAGDAFRPGGLGITKELAAACGLQPGERVLDLGCGVGSTAAYLRQRWSVETCGIDTSPDFLAEAKARDPEGEWVLGRAEALPFPGGHFDAVFSECFLSAVADSAAVLSEIARVLRPGGRLALSDMYLRDPEARHLRLAPPATCLRGAVATDVTLARLEQAGFAVRQWEDRSESLKALMASLIFAYGSETEFWKASAGEAPPQAILDEVRRARPGYYWLVATIEHPPARRIVTEDGSDLGEPGGD